MNTGIVKHRITVYRLPNTEDVDEVGQPLDEPVHHADLWAGIFTLRGRQIESARQYHPKVPTKIVIRYRKDINDEMFALYDDKKFEFLYVLHENYAKKELHIYTREQNDV